MPNLRFIRHAETELNREGIFAGRTDCNITKEGFEQAKEVLKNNEKKFDYIYCSPLKRTKFHSLVFSSFLTCFSASRKV